MTCQYASSGCNDPEGECIGLCMQKQVPSDRELLKLAAKAAGLELSEYQSSDASAPLWLDRKHANPITHSRDWNPLTDDGDALRLAVKCELHLGMESHVVSAWHKEKFGRFCTEPLGPDPNAAARRAIVRASAEIGKSKP